MNFEEINFSQHVEKRIVERKIDKKLIFETILYPDKTIHKSENEIHYLKKYNIFANKFLKVVFNPNKKLVVTTHIDKKNY